MIRMKFSQTSLVVIPDSIRNPYLHSNARGVAWILKQVQDDEKGGEA